MRQTAVPAQVTTVEDRIVGNLGIVQIALLAVPVLATGLVLVLVPPAMHLSIMKLACLIIITAICGGLAIRIKGTLVLFWIIIRLLYNVRPRYYVFSKNTTAHRRQYGTVTAASLISDEPEVTLPKRQALNLSSAEMLRVMEAIENPAANLAFTTNKKGGLYVRITEIKSKG